jgi:hypothetical protein
MSRSVRRQRIASAAVRRAWAAPWGGAPSALEEGSDVREPSLPISATRGPIEAPQPEPYAIGRHSLANPIDDSNAAVHPRIGRSRPLACSPASRARVAVPIPSIDTETWRSLLRIGTQLEWAWAGFDTHFRAAPNRRVVDGIPSQLVGYSGVHSHGVEL